MKDFVLDLYEPLDPADKTERLNKKIFDSYNEYEVTKALKTIMCKQKFMSYVSDRLYMTKFLYSVI